MTKKKFWYIFVGSLMTLITVTIVISGTALYWAVVIEPGDEIQIGSIRRILGKESPVFYSDGKTRVGVFFDEAHRQYVNYEDIPANFVNALVASEDNLFFSHFGFDPVGIARAAIKNIQAGKVVQGGSTLTQQTAKNLFKRRERSLQAKLKELLYALRLEYHYSKEQIFEFYANQFYVAGNSHGLGVAARYYFDKQPSELTLLECAFIAGSVKRPNYYNPFTKKDEEAILKAKKRARARVNYVLEKMFELKMIDSATYQKARQSEIGFEKGQVGYAFDYVMDMVSEAVSATEVQDALKEHGIDNVATSGIRVVTSIDHSLQEKTLYALRRQLSQLDVRLRGYEREEVQGELAELQYKGDAAVKEKAFLFGQVLSVDDSQNNYAVQIDLGSKKGIGIVDEQGLSRIVSARTKWQKNPWAESDEGNYADLLEQLHEGDQVWVSVRTIQKDGSLLLDLERFPLVQGGALVMRDGMIRAMAGGVENRFYNRAISAGRTMGSAFKPFVFAAAMQLGWSSADLLKNKRDVFIFQNQPYFPRPDHDSPHDWVSLSWAGVHSENVASVWLLYHLCDHLGLDQLRNVASHLNMAPKIINGEEEPYRNFKARMRDRYGIVVNRETLRQAAYDHAVANLETDFIFAGRQKEYDRLKQLHYGMGFDSFANSIREELDKDVEGSDSELSKAEKKELTWREDILASNFLALEELFKEMQTFIDKVDAYSMGLYEFEEFQDFDRADIFYDRFNDDYLFTRLSSATSAMIPIEREKLRKFIQEQDEEGQKEFWENVRLGGVLSVAAFRLVSEQLKRDLKRLEEKLPYSMDVLSLVRDYRVMLGLRYLISLGRQAGIRSQLEPVLSFPLGSNVTTLLEAVRMYEGLATGKVFLPGEEGEENQDLLTVLDRIESADGEILYRPERTQQDLLTSDVRVSIGHVLENIVKFGTGRYADRNVKISTGQTVSGQSFSGINLKVPLLGKTGTANRYTNAAFLGYLPGIADERDAMVVENGYAVGVYVGFDDNKVMRRGATKVTGALGALPAWTEIVNDLLVEEEYTDKLDPVDLSFNGLIIRRSESGLVNLSVDRNEGGKLGKPVKTVDDRNRYSPSIMAAGRLDNSGVFIPDRRPRPFWQSNAR